MNCIIHLFQYNSENAVIIYKHLRLSSLKTLHPLTSPEKGDQRKDKNYFKGFYCRRNSSKSYCFRQ